jgi:hypothetical protein
LKQAYNIHKDDSEVVEAICHVFKQLCSYGESHAFSMASAFFLFFSIIFFVAIIEGEMKVEMKSLKLDGVFFSSIVKRYRDNKVSGICGNPIFASNVFFEYGLKTYWNSQLYANSPRVDFIPFLNSIWLFLAFFFKNITNLCDYICRRIQDIKFQNDF